MGFYLHSTALHEPSQTLMTVTHSMRSRQMEHGLNFDPRTAMACGSLTHIPGIPRELRMHASNNRKRLRYPELGIVYVSQDDAVDFSYLSCPETSQKHKPCQTTANGFRFYIRTRRSHSQNCLIRPRKADMKLFICGVLPVENLLLTIHVSNSTVARRPVS